MNSVEARKELARLILENPELPVMPTVNIEVVDDDGYAYYNGRLGGARIDEYCVIKNINNDDHTLFKSYDDDPFTVAEEMNVDFDEVSDDEIQKIYDNLPWKR